MKSPIPSFLLVLALFASIAIAATEPKSEPVGYAKRLLDDMPEVTAIKKERDEAKAQVAQLQQQNQQQQIVAEYYKAVAEKNDAVLRLVALQQELTATKAELEKVKAELDAAKKPAEAKK